MSTENTWTPAQSFAIGTVKIGGDAIKVEEPIVVIFPVQT